MKKKTEAVDLYEYEHALRLEGVSCLCGVDEAGRGPLCGPVYAAAVILPDCVEIPGLNDSKKLTEKRREALYEQIIAAAHAYSIASVSAKDIDEINILQATYCAMSLAIEGLGVEPQLCLIDGNRCEGIAHNCRCVVRGDAKCASIAAASILAKVSRDRYMMDYALKYPQYAFDKHKGYGTKLHYEALRQYGPSPEHRLTFLKKMH